jgi:DNA-binding transcriptional LysR family regulator
MTRPLSGKRPKAAVPVDLNDVVALVRVVDAGSFTGAASQMGLPKSAVSRRVARLEEALGVRLLQRTTRSLHLTDAGVAYHARAAGALSALSEARDVATEATGDPRGTVRITAPLDMGGGQLAEVLTRFAIAYPKVCVEVELTGRIVDLVAENFDLAVRAGVLRDSSLVARRLGESRHVIVASPEYVAKRGAPKTPADLAKHDCILWRAKQGESKWVLDGPNGQETVVVRGSLSGDDYTFVRAAAMQGAGIAMVPSPSIIDFEAGRLQPLLTDWRGPSGPVHLVYPSARFLPQRVAVLRDFLVEHFRIPDLCPKLKEKCDEKAKANGKKQPSPAAEPRPLRARAS